MNDQDDSDASLIRRIGDSHDESALELLLERHAPAIHRFLRSRFADSIGDAGIHDVLNCMALKLWNKASSVAPESLGGWLIVAARNAALDLLDKQSRHPPSFGEYDPIDPHDADDNETLADEDRWIVDELHTFSNNLSGLQKKVMMADIAIGGSADSENLARLHNSTKNSIEVTRSRVRQKFRARIESLKLERSSTGSGS